MADIWDAMKVSVEIREKQSTLVVKIDEFERKVVNASFDRKLLARETMRSAEEIAEIIASIIVNRVREQLSKIEQADEQTGGTE